MNDDKKLKSQELTLTNKNQLTVLPADVDPFAAIADATAPQHILPGSTLLKFIKGDWIAGQNSEPIKLGTKALAAMDEYVCGWVKWQGNKPKEHIMARIARGEAPPPRDALGDLDQSSWELNDKGEPKDCWQFTHYLGLWDIEANKLYTYTTSSRGGFSAIGVLCRIYANGRKKYPDSFPVVALETGAYAHKEFNRVKTPALTAVRWAPKSDFYNATGITPEGNDPTNGGGAAPAAQAEPDTTDDPIPF
jgi:hypothetical protein